jgi:hypothetical protein
MPSILAAATGGEKNPQRMGVRFSGRAHRIRDSAVATMALIRNLLRDSMGILPETKF